MSYENQSYHHVRIHGPCVLISSPNEFIFILKLHSNRIMCAEVGNNGFEIISQTSSVVKYFISFFHSCHEILTIISFHCLAQMEIIFMRIFSAKILGLQG